MSLMDTRLPNLKTKRDPFYVLMYEQIASETYYYYLRNTHYTSRSKHKTYYVVFEVVHSVSHYSFFKLIILCKVKYLTYNSSCKL